MAERPRVLHVVRDLAPYGVPRVILDLCRLVSDFEHAVLSFEGGRLAADLRASGAKVYAPEEPRNTLPSLRSMYRNTSAALRDWRPVLVHGHRDYGNIIGTWVANRAGIPSIAHVHGQETSRYGELTYRAAYRSVARRATLVACSQGLADHFWSRTGIRPLAIYNGVDSSRFAARGHRPGTLRRDFGICNGAGLVGTVGRLEPVKDYTMLLEVARLLAERGAEVHFVAIGDGTLRAALEQQRDALGLQGRFHFLGYRGDVPSLVGEFDVFAFCSKGEGLGLGVVEAMAAGCPVVASDVCGVNEVVEAGETGYLVASGAAEEMADRIGEMLRDEMLRERMGRAGRRRVEECFSLARMAGDFSALYERLLAERSAGKRRGKARGG